MTSLMQRCRPPGRPTAWRRLGDAGMRALFRAGVLGWAHCLWPHRLTVLAYHRIADPQAPDFVGLAANVSASPEQFSAQLDLLRRWFNVISLDQLLDWLAGHAELPRYPLLITFDDGYHDNFGEALPALRARGLPAVLFLATSCVNSDRPFFWDAAAYCFSRTRRRSADLPLLGPRRLDDADARNRVLADWLAAAKRLPVAEHGALSRSLQAAVAVEIPVSAFAGQHLNWKHVAELAHSGLAIASHTHSHAILSAATLEEARAEVLGAYRRIEAELGGAPPIFAYPNGQPGDFRGEDVAMLRREGFVAAFTLLEGPTGLAAARRDPLQIRRILVMHDQELANFAASVTGVIRLLRSLRRIAVHLVTPRTRQ